MKTKILPLAIICMYFGSCSKEATKTKEGIPDCLNTTLIKIRSGFATCPTGAALQQYSLNGKTVYLYEPGNCVSDANKTIIDSNCNEVGWYGGGWGGQTKVYGDDFINAVYVKTIWEN
ncbi:MAG: hypothetical protein WC716_02035 [Chitinophagaceae bacterium]|jgi:hypothetical protein